MIRNWEDIDRYLIALGVRIGQPTLELTTGGGHARGAKHLSFHYLGTARDYPQLPNSDDTAIARRLEFIALQPDGPIVELFSANASIFIKDGQRISPVKIDLWNEHLNHCHVALKPGRRLF